MLYEIITYLMFLLIFISSIFMLIAIVFRLPITAFPAGNFIIYKIVYLGNNLEFIMVHLMLGAT